MKLNLSPDNSVFTVINKIVDLMWLSILWSLIALPLFLAALFVIFGFEDPGLLPIVALPIGCILIGPASAALYYAVVKVIRRERGYATKCFFHSFKQNFKQGVLSSLIYGLFVGILYVDLLLAPQTMQNQTVSSIFTGVLFVNAILALFILTWLNPILSRFTVTLKELIKNSFVTAIRCFIRTFIMAAMWFGIGYVLWNYGGAYLTLLPFFLPGLSALIRSFIIEPVFKKLAGDQSEAEQNGVDAWYAE